MISRYKFGLMLSLFFLGNLVDAPPAHMLALPEYMGIPFASLNHSQSPTNLMLRKVFFMGSL